MTYREMYKQLHPEADVSEIHLAICPDTLFLILPGFRCPFPDVDPIPEGCRDCWDTEIPTTKK